MAYAFAGILGLNRNFTLEKDRGTLDGLLLAPVSRDVIYAGKVLGALTIMLVVEALMIPVFLLFYDLQVLTPWFVLTTVAATLGFAAVGTVFSAIAANTRSREIMLPLLFLPVILPVIIAAVAATGSVVEGEGWSQMDQWIQLIFIFDIVFLVVSSFAFELVLGE